MEKLNYKGYTVTIANGSHCGIVYKNGEMVNCIAGDIIVVDGEKFNNCWDKCQKWIDEQK